jgi:hypothetical protein
MDDRAIEDTGKTLSKTKQEKLFQENGTKI